MDIGFLGDLHGNLAAGRFMLWSMHKLGITRVVHVGDFGIYTDNNGMKFASKMNEYAEEWGITLLVVPGNHENWRVINEIFEGDNREQFASYRSNILLVPRGMRWTWDDMTFVGLGGAPSVDRSWRRQADSRNKALYVANKNWYAEEAITDADVAYVAAGGYADVMIGHDAPAGIQGINRVIRGNPHGFDPADLLYAEDGRRQITAAFKAVAPRFYFHGHYHTPVNEHIQRPGGQWGVDTTHVIGLDCEFKNYSMGVLSTTTKHAINIDHTDLLNQYREEGHRPWGAQ